MAFQRAQGLIFEPLVAWVAEADEVAEVAVTATGNNAVDILDTESLAQQADHFAGHGLVVAETHRLGGEALFHAEAELFHQAQVEIIVELVD